MVPQDPTAGPDLPDQDDPEAAVRAARQRFLASFPKRSDSIGLLLSRVATVGPRGPVGPLRHAVHQLCGLAGTLGFPTVSARARERGLPQLGSLGSGDHFCELGYVAEVYDEPTARAFGLFADQVTVMIHSGSRGLGYQVCDDALRMGDAL